MFVQYGIVVFFAVRKRASQVYIPLGFCVATFLATAIAFAALTQIFQPGQIATTSSLVEWGNSFYIIIALEAAAIIGIAMIWRTLSFKKTHLVERLGLLTLIVIGEGAIGVTKTVSKIMGKDGLQVRCVV
jgi:low temperature requirement protein LtrA